MDRVEGYVGVCRATHSCIRLWVHGISEIGGTLRDPRDE